MYSTSFWEQGNHWLVYFHVLSQYSDSPTVYRDGVYSAVIFCQVVHSVSKDVLSGIASSFSTMVLKYIYRLIMLR